MAVPGTADVLLSVFVIERSPVGVSGSVSVAELSLESGSITPLGGATVAVLASVPVRFGSTASVIVKLSEPPDAMTPVV